MIGLGTIINTAAIVAGGVAGSTISRFFDEEQQNKLTAVTGVSVLFIAISGAMQGMLEISEEGLSSGRSMLVVLCLALGDVAGELLGIEKLFERLGSWLKEKSGNKDDSGFINAFVSASLTVCIGAMAIVGSIQDGVSGDSSTLCVKAVLDFIIIAVMSSSLGKGATFSCVPVAIFEGSITLLAFFLAPALSELAISYISLIGSILIFCVGVNLVWGNKFSVANMLPAILFAALAAYLPIAF